MIVHTPNHLGLLVFRCQWKLLLLILNNDPIQRLTYPLRCIWRKQGAIRHTQMRAFWNLLQVWWLSADDWILGRKAYDLLVLLEWEHLKSVIMLLLGWLELVKMPSIQLGQLFIQRQFQTPLFHGARRLRVPNRRQLVLQLLLLFNQITIHTWIQNVFGFGRAGVFHVGKWLLRICSLRLNRRHFNEYFNGGLIFIFSNY